MKARILTAVVLGGCLGGLPACSTYHQTDQAVAPAADRYHATMDEFRERDPSMQRFFDTAYGYVVFPKVDKGAVVVGGAGGNGAVYSHGQLIGYATIGQATVGAQLGGQAYSEMVFFENKAAMDKFQRGEVELAAQASAVAAANGAAADADYAEGVAVFTLPEAGLMVEASVGGQKFTFRPL